MLHQGESRLGVRKKLLSEGVVKHWNKLSGDVVMAPSLLVLKKCLDNTLKIRFNFEVALCAGRSWDLVLVGPFQCRLFSDDLV